MISSGIKKYLINPSMGLLTGALFLILYFVTKDLLYSFLIPMVFSILSDFSLRLWLKTRVCGSMFLINLCALVCTFVVWFFLKENNISDLFFLILYEILLVCLMFLTNLSKTYVTFFFGKNKNLIQRTYLGDVFEVAKFTQYGITFHLFYLLIYSYGVVSPEQIDLLGFVSYFVIPIAIFFSIILYKEIKTRNVVKNLRKEEWLPIVNESGEVTGRIAGSVSRKMRNKFLHPVVRIALVYKGELYLKKRLDTDLLDPSTYDHPFEKYMLFNQEINTTVEECLSHGSSNEDLPSNFLLKYVYENNMTKRLIFLFVSRLDTEKQVQSLELAGGKFWTVKQIEDSFNDNQLFSECFQLEFEYLKNTVLQSEIQKNSVTIGC